MTWKSATGVLIVWTGALFWAGWDTANEIRDQVATRVSKDEFNRHVEQQNRWQDKLESRIDTVIQNADVGLVSSQLQYVVVQPSVEAELHNQRVREVLAQRGFVDVASKR